MTKTLTSIKNYFNTRTHESVTRTEIRAIVRNYTFASNTADLSYEDLDSAATLASSTA